MGKVLCITPCLNLFNKNTMPELFSWKRFVALLYFPLSASIMKDWKPWLEPTYVLRIVSLFLTVTEDSRNGVVRGNGTFLSYWAGNSELFSTVRAEEKANQQTNTALDVS